MYMLDRFHNLMNLYFVLYQHKLNILLLRNGLMRDIEDESIVIVSLSSVKNTLFTKVPSELFSFKLAVTFVITLPPVEPSLNLGASFGVTIMCIVLFVELLNVSVIKVTSTSYHEYYHLMSYYMMMIICFLLKL